MTWFELGKILYEARIREAWNFGGTHAEDRLARHPYPRHPADPDPRCEAAEIQLAQAQAKALLKVASVTPSPTQARGSAVRGEQQNSASGAESSCRYIGDTQTSVTSGKEE